MCRMLQCVARSVTRSIFKIFYQKFIFIFGYFCLAHSRSLRQSYFSHLLEINSFWFSILFDCSKRKSKRLCIAQRNSSNCVVHRKFPSSGWNDCEKTRKKNNRENLIFSIFWFTAGQWDAILWLSVAKLWTLKWMHAQLEHKSYECRAHTHKHTEKATNTR